MNNRVHIEILDGVTNPALTPEIWLNLLETSSIRSIFLTEEWHKTWWQVLGRGKPVVAMAFRNDAPIAMAPLYFQHGIGYFNGASEDSYYLDFIGNNRAPAVLIALLEAARKSVPSFKGFEFHWLRDDSATTALLPQLAEALGLKLVKLWELSSPTLELQEIDQAEAIKLTSKKRLRYIENALRKKGDLEINFYRNPEEILDLLPHFFDQHIQRWAPAGVESRFLRNEKRRFYEEITRVLGVLDKVSLSVVKLNGDFAAFDFGLIESGCYTLYQGSYEISLSKLSPGQIGLKYTLLKAISEAYSEFDLGPGDHPYKLRFANRINRVSAWGLY